MIPDRGLSQRARQILGTMATIVCPPEIAALGLVERVVDHVEHTLATMPAHVRASILAGLAVYETGAVVRFGQQASKLTGMRARRYFLAWRRGLGVQRDLVKVLKGFLCLAYYEMPEVQEAMGYHPGAWIEAARIRRLARYTDDIRQQETRLREPEPLPRAAKAAALKEPAP